jgi:hypothetical protein
MTEPAASLESAAIVWASALVATSPAFQTAVGAVDQPTALTHCYETDQAADLGSHAVIEVDGGELENEATGAQGVLIVSITLLQQPLGGLATDADTLRRARTVAANIRQYFCGQVNVFGYAFKGPVRLPPSCPWPEWYGTLLTFRVLGGEFPLP